VHEMPSYNAYEKHMEKHNLGPVKYFRLRKNSTAERLEVQSFSERSKTKCHLPAMPRYSTYDCEPV